MRASFILIALLLTLAFVFSVVDAKKKSAPADGLEIDAQDGGFEIKFFDGEDVVANEGSEMNEGSDFVDEGSDEGSAY
jgi:hypothetical protein